MKRSTVFAAVMLLAASAQAQVYHFEAESGIFSGVNFAASGSGYSGTGYVTGFNNDADKVTINAGGVPDGLYELRVGYRSPSGFKGYGFHVEAGLGDQVNIEKGDGSFNGSSIFTYDRAGVFNLTGANKSLQITKGWGFFDVDYLELRPATVTSTLPVAPALVDPQASPHTQQLMNYLAGLYGSKTLAGQQGNVGQNAPFPSSMYLARSDGALPAVRGSDFIEYSPSRIAHGANPNGESERVIDWAQKTGGVVTMMWHWNAPTDLIDGPDGSPTAWYRGFYTEATTFDVQAVLAAPGSTKYNMLVSDIDAIAVQLQKFEDAGVPVLWRPLHEAQGNPGAPGWFWWGAKGPEPFKQLWRLMHDRLTNHHGLHNLIWEYTSSAAYEGFEQWYPGDDVVDIIGADLYTDPTSSMSGAWHDLLDAYNGEKMIALSESGTLPDPEAFDERGVHWSYFSPWQIEGDPYGVLTNYTTDELQAILNHDDVITLDELSVMPWKTNGTLLADFDGNGFVDGGDLLAWQRERHFRTVVNPLADANGDSIVEWTDLAIWRRQFGQSASPPLASVPEPTATCLAWLGAAGVWLARRRVC